MKKILVIGTILPSENLSGGILIRNVLSFLLDSNYRVDYLSIKNIDIKEDINQEILNKINYKELNYKNKNLNAEIVDLITKNEITKVLLLNVREHTLYILDYIKRNTNISTFIFCADPLEWFLKCANITENKRKEILELRDKVLSESSFIYTGSQQMAKLYKKKYNKKASPLYISLKKNSLKKYIRKDSSSIKIVLSGQLYAKDTIKSFISSLDKLNWIYNGKKIYFQYYGNDSIDFAINENNKNNIICKSWLSQEKLIEEMNKSDILYCPYMFSKNTIEKAVSKYSFPSKIVSYLAASTHLIVHAPSYSTVNKFFKNTESAYIIDTNNLDKNFKSLKRILERFEYDTNRIEKLNKIFMDNFTYDIIQCDFIEKLEGSDFE